MGDHRASIKIQMEFHGVKDECDMWINYFPEGEYYDVDDRVIEFIRNVYRRGMVEYEKTMEKYYAGEREKEERKELERLKEKYG